MKMKNEKVTIEFCDVELDVVFDYSCDSGYWRDSNGDGLPPSEDLYISSVCPKGTDVDIFSIIEGGGLLSSLEERILEKVSDLY